MSNAKIFEDAEGAVRTWARANTALQAKVAQRSFFGVPEGGTTFPFIVLRRVGGGTFQGETPEDYPLIQFDVWGSSKAQAADVAAALKSEAESIVPGTRVGDLVFLGARVTLDLWSPDPADDQPRYIIDVEFTVKGV